MLVLSVVREANRPIHDRALNELRRSRSELVVRSRDPGALGKFDNLNTLLEDVELDDFDWVVLAR